VFGQVMFNAFTLLFLAILQKKTNLIAYDSLNV